MAKVFNINPSHYSELSLINDIVNSTNINVSLMFDIFSITIKIISLDN